ncbi:MAG: DUF3754 domain-containing protein [Pirellulales bacterium]|jgi:hypothetical protein|nr:DUF3754 domain-containing protein [Thermoguttaceae bacterium]MDD4786745.1 DUF3754 domain-containing protein [Pirellulales bacterium]MDI9445564.1 DUF3754 domain-containing protein [Planctomycetota bacterium]NLZ01662.1 DUF3754 domain-containing protein [Pirellulaceae bacterium]
MPRSSPTPALDFLVSRERFLPLKADAIFREVIRSPSLSAEQRRQFRLFLQMVRARFHFEFLEQVQQLKQLYDPFDPDRDTRLLRQWTPAEREQAFCELRCRCRDLLLSGNYVQLSREQLLACMESRNRFGLAIRVNLDDYEVLDVYYRGVREGVYPYRNWSTCFRQRTAPVRVFSRVAILVRHKPGGRRKQPKADVVLVKLFKDVALEDLKMTSPEVRVQMKLLDKIKVGGTVAGGLAAPIARLLTAAMVSPILLLAVVGGCTVAFFKGLFSFLTSKTKYMQRLSSNLYHKSLANNASALALLVDAAEAEETKELLLAYHILLSEPDGNFTIQQLDARVEKWLKDRFGLPEVDFEVDDAVRKLIEKGLIEVRDEPRADGTTDRLLKACDLATALERLDRWWDDCFSPASSADAQLAGECSRS